MGLGRSRGARRSAVGGAPGYRYTQDIEQRVDAVDDGLWRPVARSGEPLHGTLRLDMADAFAFGAVRVHRCLARCRTVPDDRGIQDDRGRDCFTDAILDAYLG